MEPLDTYERRYGRLDDYAEKWIGNIRCNCNFPGCDPQRTKQYYDVLSRFSKVKLFRHGGCMNDYGITYNDKAYYHEYKPNASHDVWRMNGGYDDYEGSCLCWCQALKRTFKVVSLNLLELACNRITELEITLEYAPPGKEYLEAKRSFESTFTPKVG